MATQLMKNGKAVAPRNSVDGIPLVQIVGDDVPHTWRTGDLDLVREDGSWRVAKRVEIAATPTVATRSGRSRPLGRCRHEAQS